MKLPDKNIILFLLVFTAIGVAVALNATSIEDWIAENESWLSAYLKPENFENNAWLLILTAFLGGFIASLSPCILALLPVNLSYIGALNASSRRQAVTGAALFVLGVVLVLSGFGLVSSFANAVIVDYKGWVHIGVGVISVLLGAGLLGAFKIRVPEGATGLEQGAAPFIVGTSFALVTSPCASPILLAMMLIAGTSGPALSVATMVSYALGYTFVLMVCSVLVGAVKQMARLKQYGVEIARLGGAILMVAGLYYVVSGLVWFREM